ncbi:MAG TPA: amphi-Trp domain-containing protein [Dehalococcoidia bacterium]|nr:amphi-Trp domain-containing protein [Dehalococcoidia bacterium]
MAKKARDESTSADNGSTKRRSARYTAEISIADAAAYLEAVAHALRENRLVVQADKKTLDALVAPRLTLDVAAKASRGGRRTSLDLSLRWKERYDGSSPAPPSESNSEESSAETAVSPAPEPPPSDSTFDPE